MKILDARPENAYELATKIAVLRQFIKGLQKRWGPFGDLPEGIAILAQLDELARATQQYWEELVSLQRKFAE
jgi:hypothetical protein